MEVDLGKLHAERAQRLAAQARLPKAAGDVSSPSSSPSLPELPIPAAAASGKAGVLTSCVREVRLFALCLPVASLHARGVLRYSLVYFQDFDCSLCMKLLVEPVSLACGHTYCRACLIRAISVQPCCPYCRAPSFASPRDQPQNYLLSKVIPQVALRSLLGFDSCGST